MRAWWAGVWRPREPAAKKGDSPYERRTEDERGREGGRQFGGCKPDHGTRFYLHAGKLTMRLYGSKTLARPLCKTFRKMLPDRNCATPNV